MLGVWDELHDNWYDYFRSAPYQTWPVFGRAILDLIVLAALFWPLIAAAKRLRHPMLRKGCCALLIAVFVVGLETLRTHGLRLYGAAFLKILGQTGLLVAGGILALVLLYLLLFRDRMLTRALQVALTILAAAVPIHLISTAWAIHSTWPADRYMGKPPPPLLPPRPEAPRVIWVIFDSWGYDRSFPQRRPGLSLPEVDRFQREALYAENALPPATRTLESIPSLTLGRIVAAAHHPSPDELYVTFRGSGEKAGWSTQPNIFQDARAAGFNSAVIGFHHPYPRVLGGTVTESYFLPMMTLHQTPLYWSEWRGLQRLRMEGEDALNRPPFIQDLIPLRDRRNKRILRLVYLELRERAIRAVGRPELGLVFLHLPIPHMPAIYDRRRKEITATGDGDYDDNLELVDRTLGELRQAIEATGDWDRSVVLLSTDHPPHPDRYSEHPRVPFLLKMPGQRQSLRYTEPFNTVMSHDLVLAALRGELRTAEDVAVWLNHERLRFPTEAVKR
jgi:hypothetical protein